ncbi:MAG TPA: hypothetical protein VFW44_09455 [Bryobacteraceae bacterium]|nr:hypothetical protein [Bryobacteraceae bacterium]
MKTQSSAKWLIVGAAAFAMSAVAQAPSSGGAKSPGLNATEATAPAGGSANPDTRKARPRRDDTPHGPTPRLADGHPDLSGVWQGGGPVGDLAQGLAKGETIPILPAAKAQMEARQSQNDPEANCLPTGIPRIAPYPWRIVQTPTHVFFLFEGNIHSYRQIFMNAKHPADPDPTWYGHSTATWDGDTLVVDTIGFNDKFWFDFKGHPHTEQLHTIERYTRKDEGTLENKVTIIDPGDYSKPFTLTFTARLRPHEELMEYICQENQQDSQHMSGNAGLPQNP